MALSLRALGIILACSALLPRLGPTASVLAAEGSAARNAPDTVRAGKVDQGPWQRFLDRYLDTNRADGIHRLRYADVTDADRRKLAGHLAALQSERVSSLDRKEQEAFWINLYNAETVALVLDHYPVNSIRDIGMRKGSGPWDDSVVKVEGRTLSLNDMENRILRPIWADPRIHFALNCASLGCPNLASEAYAADKLETMLERGAHDFINAPRGLDVQKDGLHLSAIFQWYRDDFGKSDSAVLAFIRRYAEPGILRRLPARPGNIRYGYDWSLNDGSSRREGPAGMPGGIRKKP